VSGTAERPPGVAASPAPLAYDRRGSGPPLVLLHPLGADRRVWDPVLDRLAAERDVIALDLPGFGASPPLALPDGQAPAPARLADAVRAFVEADLGLGGAPWHVAGNSLGGWVALQLALDGGDVASVTAIAPAGLWSRPLGAKPDAARRAAALAAPIVGPAARVPALRRAILGGVVAHPERVPADAAARLVRVYGGAPGYAAVNAAMRAGTFTQLAEIGVPVTLAWPDRDRLVGRPRRLPPQVRDVTLAACGHLPMWDDPDTVATVLLSGSAPR
jgi:pimeloyl-ACP methyl ester carboxylesterase